MKRNGKQIIIILILLIIIFGMSIGFAVLSTHLTIDGKVIVTPENTFQVRLSKSANSFLSGELNADKTIDDAVDNGYLSEYGGTALISSDGKTLNNIKAYFTIPGQVVTYTFYAVNNIGYDAYLDSVTFIPSSEKCTIPTGSNANINLVNEACNNIIISIKIGEEDYWTINDDTSDIYNHKIDKSIDINNLNSEIIKVKVEYLGNKVANGKFLVNLGEIKINYTTLVKE